MLTDGIITGPVVRHARWLAAALNALGPGNTAKHAACRDGHGISPGPGFVL